MLEFLKCTPMLKTIRCAELGDPYVDVSKKLKESLRLVRYTIEAVEFEGSFNCNDNTTGGIGPFKDFLKLKKISTNITSLIPWLDSSTDPSNQNRKHKARPKGNEPADKEQRQ